MSAPDAEMGKALAYDNEKETMPDIRIDPADRKAYTLEELMDYYKKDYEKSAIEAYWQKCQLFELINVNVFYAYSSERKLQLRVAINSTVRELRELIERSIRSPVQLLSSSDALLDDENKRLDTFVSAGDLVIKFLVRAWTDEEIELAMINVRKGWSYAEHILTTMGETEQVVMAVVRAKGTFLQYVSNEMRSNHRVCTAAIAQDWRALEFVSQDMKKKTRTV